MKYTWVFYDDASHQSWRIDKPEDHPGFLRWEITRKDGNGRIRCKRPFVSLDGIRVLLGTKQPVTQHAEIPCGPACKRAMPWTACVCSCHAKNHGKEYIGPGPTDEEDARKSGARQPIPVGLQT